MNTQPYRPSNGTEGEFFMAQWCNRCHRDAAFRAGEGDSCPIVAATLIHAEWDAGYPPEWVCDADAEWPGNPRCTAFKPVEQPDGGVITDLRQMALLPTPTRAAMRRIEERRDGDEPTSQGAASADDGCAARWSA